MATTLSVFGAGGKMGCRIADNLRNSQYSVRYVEVSPAGVQRLRDRGLDVTPHEEAVRAADVAILALPDALIGRIAPTIVPGLRSGAMVICLDPAAPYGGELPERSDITYFVTHPAIRRWSMTRPTRKPRWISSAPSRPSRTSSAP